MVNLSASAQSAKAKAKAKAKAGLTDTTATDTTATDATAVDTTATDATAVDTTATDATAVDTTATDATAVDTTATDTTATDATAGLSSKFITSVTNATFKPKIGKLNVATYCAKFAQYQIEYTANLATLATVGKALNVPANVTTFKALTKRQASLIRKLVRVQVGLGLPNLVYVLPTPAPTK